MLFNKFNSGANIDTRSNTEKLKDYTLEEIVASASPVEWAPKMRSDWRKFPITEQNGSGSCVAQSLAKQLGIMYWLENNEFVPFSATHIYQRRANKPQSGMGGVNALDIARQGVTLEGLVRSDNMTDVQMDSVKIPEYKNKVGEIFKISNYITLPIKDIETVASVIQTTGKGVMVWFYWKTDEWTEMPTVKYSDLDITAPTTARHSVTAVDFSLENGEKSLIVDDSWGSKYAFNGQRIITESFFKERNFFAAYPMNFTFDTVDKPHYTFTKSLSFGMDDPDVVGLQNILKYEALFPSNASSTGYYGAITAKGTLEFQKRYGVALEPELSLLQGRLVGPKTLAKLNELYG